MVGLESEQSENAEKDLPTHIAYLIVWTRFLLTGSATFLVMYAIHPLVGLPVLPPLSTSATPELFVLWLVAFGIEAIVTAKVLFWPTIAVSWGVAWLVSPFVREEFREYMEEHEQDDKQGKNGDGD